MGQGTVLSYLQLFDGHASIEQPFGQAVRPRRGGHGQLRGQGDEGAHVDHAGAGRRPQQRQVLLTRRQERTERLGDRKWDSHGGYFRDEKTLSVRGGPPGFWLETSGSCCSTRWGSTDRADRSADGVRDQ